MMKILLTLLIVLTPLCAAAQGVRHDNIAFRTAVPSLSAGVAGSILQPIPNAVVTVCAGSTLPAVGVACSPTTTVYSNIGLTTVLSNPTNADGNGNYFFYATGGLQYVVSVAGSGLTTYSYVWTAPPSLGGANSWTGVQSFPGGVASFGLLTLPVGPDTLVGRATTDTLTNKTLTSPTSTGTDSGTEALTNKTFDISLNILKTATNTVGHYPRNNGTQYLDAVIAAVDLPVFVASGASHAPGAVPDPGSSAGTTRYLREDSTWIAGTGTGVPVLQTGGTLSTPTLTTPTINYGISPAGALTVRNRAVLGSNASITANTVTTILSTTVTAPTAGGTFRAIVSWGMQIQLGGSDTCSAWVDDGTGAGTPTFAFSSTGNAAAAADNTGFNSNDISPNTYANSTALTFTLKTSCLTASTAQSAPQGGTGSIGSTFITVVLVPAI